MKYLFFSLNVNFSEEYFRNIQNQDFLFRRMITVFCGSGNGNVENIDFFSFFPGDDDDDAKY